MIRRFLSVMHSLQTILRFPPFPKFHDTPIDRALRSPDRESVDSLVSYAHCATQTKAVSQLSQRDAIRKAGTQDYFLDLGRSRKLPQQGENWLPIHFFFLFSCFPDS